MLSIVLYEGGNLRAQEAQDPVPPQAVESPAPPEQKAPPSRSEERIGPTPGTATVSLARAVMIALERNFGLLSAADGVRAARVREGTAKAGFYPTLTPAFQRLDKDTQLFKLDASQRLPWLGASVTAGARYQSAGSSSMSDTSDLSVVLTQPLLRGFGPNATMYELRNSRRAREGQERNFELARQRLAVDVASAFYQVVKQRQLMAVARQSYERSRSLSEASAARMQVGLASKLDVLRADLQASQAQESMVSFETSLQSALESFRVLLGGSPDDPFEPEEVVLPENVEIEVEPLEVLSARARANRLDLKETRDQIRDAERTAALSRQNLLPQLDLTLTYTRTGFGGGFSDSFSAATSPGVRFALTTSYPLQRINDLANKALSEMDVEARRRALVQREYEVEADVRSAVRNLERIRKSVELQRKSMDFAQQQHRLATLRYQRGLASNFDVIDAEGSLVAARTALVGLITDLQVARIQLLRAVGTLDPDQEFAQ